MKGVLGLPKEFSSSIKTAANILKKQSFVRVISHYDADGISAAGVFITSLKRANIDFHTTITRSLDSKIIDRLSQDTSECSVFLDMGSGQVESLESMGGTIIALDHHRPLRDSEKVTQVNPHFFGMDGMTDISASGLAFAVSIAMDETNWSSAPIAIAGLIGDMQDVNGLSQANTAIIEGAVQRDLLSRTNGLRLIGDRLVNMIADSADPFFKGLSGNSISTVEFLEKAGFDANERHRNLDEVQQRRLSSLLTLRLLRQGCGYETIEQISGELLTIVANGLRVDYITELLNACGRTDHSGIGLGLCLGDVGAINEAMKFRGDYLRALIAGLMTVEGGEFEEKDHIQIIRPSNSALSGAICGISMQYLLAQDKPVISLTRAGGVTKVSARGSHSMVKRGLDLSESMRLASNKLGGVGGGHAVAAGATVPAAREDEFIESLDEIIGRQLKIE